MDQTNEAKWYVVHTYSGYENKVKTNLEKIIENRGISHLITDVKVPSEIIVEESGDQKKEVESKLFPSYVFVKMIMSDETRRLSHCASDKPRSISSRVIPSLISPNTKPALKLSPAPMVLTGIYLIAAIHHLAIRWQVDDAESVV